MKCVSRNKFLLCFRPVVDMDTAMLQSKGSGKRSLTCVSITESENEDVKLLFTKQSKSENGSSLESVKCHANKCSKRTLSRVIRAAMFQTTLSRRVRDIQHISAQPKRRNRLSLSEDEPGSNIHAEDAGKSSIPSLTSTEEPKNCSQILKQRRVEVGHSSKPKNGILFASRQSHNDSSLGQALCNIVQFVLAIFSCPEILIRLEIGGRDKTSLARSYNDRVNGKTVLQRNKKFRV